MSDLTDQMRQDAYAAKLTDPIRERMLYAAELINMIDHVHVVSTSTGNCLSDNEAWPCWHHRQIHPDDPVVQEYIEKIRQEMDEIA